MIKKTRGGICAASGFFCGSISSGIKDQQEPREDTALLMSDKPCTSAATFTSNRIKAAPVQVSMEHLKLGDIRGVVLNSGNANACTGRQGIVDARAMASAAAARVGLKPEQFLVCSTGRIGVGLPVKRIEAGVSAIRVSRRGSLGCAQAIMTSDTFPKELAFSVQAEAGVFYIGGIAKGAGMINPNMATMLCVITTDASFPQPALRVALRAAVENSFNRITIDGDMSTNDTVILLANGASGVSPSLPEVSGGAGSDIKRPGPHDCEGWRRGDEVHRSGSPWSRFRRRRATRRPSRRQFDVGQVRLGWRRPELGPHRGRFGLFRSPGG